MSKKLDFVQKILSEVKLRQPFPSKVDPERPLIDEAALLVLMRHMTEAQAEASIAKLRAEFPDWNECRVSQAQEIAQHLRAGRGKKGIEHARFNTPAAHELRIVLHEIFQKTHGLDIEFLREDVAKLSKPFFEMPLLGLTAASHLLFLASDCDVPMHPGMLKFLDRMGLISKTTSVKKGRLLIDAVLPKGKEHEFTVVFHEAMDLWEDPDNPTYERFKVFQECAFGKKAHAERVALLKRLDAQRKRDDERRRREEERERKRLEAEEKKRAKEAEIEEKRRRRDAEKKSREFERQRKIAAKEKARIKAEADRKKAIEAEKRAAEREKIKAAKAKERAEKKAAAKAAAAAKKKTATKKTTKKKKASSTAARKTTKKPAKKAAKKTTKKKVTKKVVKKTTKKKAAKKPAKKVTKKPAAKKKTTTRRPARKA